MQPDLSGSCFDANKRTPVFATDVFLRVNNYSLEVDAKKVH